MGNYLTSDWPALPLMSSLVNKVHCMEALDLLPLLPDNSIDLVVTSPPYDNLRTYNGYTFDFEPIARETYRVMKPGGVVVWVVGDATINGSETLTSMRQALYFVDVCGFRMHDTMIYQKNASSPNTHHPRYLQEFEYMFVLVKEGDSPVWNPIMRPNFSKKQAVAKVKTQRNGEKKAYGGNQEFRSPCPLGNVWGFNVGAASGDDIIAFDHPAVFPELLAERHILTWSNAGDVVLDYFGGSGTTPKIARKLGRKYLYCDVSQEYCHLAERRLSMPYTPDMFHSPPVSTGQHLTSSLFPAVSP